MSRGVPHSRSLLSVASGTEERKPQNAQLKRRVGKAPPRCLGNWRAGSGHRLRVRRMCAWRGDPRARVQRPGSYSPQGPRKLGRGRDSNQADFLGRSRAPAPPEPPGPRGAQGEGAGGNPAGPAGRRRFTRGHPGKTQVQGAESPPLASPSLMSQGEGERPLRGDQGAEQPREETWSPRLRRGVSQASSGEGQAPPRTPGAPHVPTWSKGARIRGNRTSCWGKPWGLPGARLLRHLGRGLHTASHHLPVLGGL